LECADQQIGIENYKSSPFAGDHGLCASALPAVLSDDFLGFVNLELGPPGLFRGTRPQFLIVQSFQVQSNRLFDQTPSLSPIFSRCGSYISPEWILNSDIGHVRASDAGET
jgi:hypothetical protein